MPKTIEGGFHAKGLRFAIVTSRFNDNMTSRLLAGALDCLQRHGAAEGDITSIRVPGAWELPALARKLAMEKSHDAILALGVLIRGETPHFDLIAAQVSRGLARAAEDSGVPVIFGVLTAETPEQAADRSGGKLGNRGWDAAMAAIETANVSKQLGRD